MEEEEEQQQQQQVDQELREGLGQEHEPEKQQEPGRIRTCRSSKRYVGAGAKAGGEAGAMEQKKLALDE